MVPKTFLWSLGIIHFSVSINLKVTIHRDSVVEQFFNLEVNGNEVFDVMCNSPLGRTRGFVSIVTTRTIIN